MAFFYVHYVLIYQTVTSLTYVFVPLDFRPQLLRCPRDAGVNKAEYKSR
ncbi:hypothetical protein FPD81_004933 [Salmonella enterica subsp. enterica serovar Heidelberg]|nr:hypothetical protein [Salmonella enterica subsp. enterica serovar Heidelberg]